MYISTIHKVPMLKCHISIGHFKPLKLLGKQARFMQRLYGVTRWLYYFSLRTMKFCQKHKIFAKVGSQFCQILNRYSTNGQKILKCCPSVEISPNLVTLTRTGAK